MPYRLLSEVLDVHESVISLAVSRISPLLEPHGITPATAGPRISTLARLHDHATAHGITINGITRQEPQNDGNQDDTPETANLKTDAPNRPRNYHNQKNYHDHAVCGHGQRAPSGHPAPSGITFPLT
jgi:hypothetical protein